MLFHTWKPKWRHCAKWSDVYTNYHTLTIIIDCKDCMRIEIELTGVPISSPGALYRRPCNRRVAPTCASFLLLSLLWYTRNEIGVGFFFFFHFVRIIPLVVHSDVGRCRHEPVFWNDAVVKFRVPAWREENVPHTCPVHCSRRSRARRKVDSSGAKTSIVGVRAPCSTGCYVTTRCRRVGATGTERSVLFFGQRNVIPSVRNREIGARPD